ncbi:MAG: ABC transporter substrate-binding protein [Candidatus Magasanikbacteria bacterium]|jgi:ABC-type branched-subunit amino acid transport system substrate-binding protein
MKNYKQLTVLICIVLVGILVFWSLNYQDNPKDTVKIGVISPITGLIQGGDNLGQGFVNGLILAQEDYKSQNPDAKFEIIIEDDGYDSKKGMSAYQKLTSINKIDALINLSSPTIDSITQNIKQQEIPVVQLGLESEIMEDTIFAIYPDQAAIGVLGTTAEQDGAKRVVIATQQIKAYESLVSDFQSNFEGETEVLRMSPSENNLKPTALKIKELNPDAVVLFMGSKEGSQLIKEMNNIGYKPNNLYFDISLQYGIADYAEMLGGLDKINGAKSLYMSSNMNFDFEQRYEKRFGERFSLLAGFGYDAYMTTVKTYDNNSEVWIKNISKYKDEGVTGTIQFNNLGVRPPTFEIAEVVNGELIVK